MKSFASVSITLAAVTVILAAAVPAPEGSTNSTTDSCYPAVGCFSNLSPWTSAVRPALPPQHPLNVTTAMYFYNRDVPDGARFSVYPEVNLTGIPFNGNKTTFMIFYGFEGNISSPWVVKLKDALLKKMDADIFIPDYNMANESYEQSAGNIRIVTKLSLMVLEALGTDPSNLHLIGFCCGAHISGYIGKAITENGNKLARITALEPRKRLFLWQDPAVRLMPDDAEFVTVFHTDITPPKMAPPTGHVDIYFSPAQSKMTKLGQLPGGPLAHDYFIASVEEGCFIGQPADLNEDAEKKPLDVFLVSSKEPCLNNSCISIGLDIKPDSRGVFLAFPNPEPPYCVPSEEEDF